MSSIDVNIQSYSSTYITFWCTSNFFRLLVMIFQASSFFNNFSHRCSLRLLIAAEAHSSNKSLQFCIRISETRVNWQEDHEGPICCAQKFDTFLHFTFCSDCCIAILRLFLATPATSTWRDCNFVCPVSGSACQQWMLCSDASTLSCSNSYIP